MACSMIFQCASCENCVEAWDDGNPYYIDLNRSLQGMPRSRCKVYVHHPSIPDQPLEGNDVPTSASTATMSFKWTPNGRERPVRNAGAETSSTPSCSKVGLARSAQTGLSRGNSDPSPDPPTILKKHPSGSASGRRRGVFEFKGVDQHTSTCINMHHRGFGWFRDRRPRHSGAGRGRRRQRFRFR
jgi:hypothetical protein